jgi:hypothetical protein
MIVLLSLVVLMIGCATVDERVVTTPAADVERIPTNIAIYPLLTGEAHVRGQGQFFLNQSVKDDRIYIVGPAETKLVSNIHSQLLTNLLSAELSKRKFTVKELPVETTPEQSNKGQNSFFVSLGTLKYLRDTYALEAILVGNVYFVSGGSDMRVKAAYLRLVDTTTLNVLCHISISDGYSGDSMGDTARALALALAKEAKLVATETK